MKCTCKNCKFAKEHEDGLMCVNSLTFVKEQDTCLDWDNDEYFNVPKWLIYTLSAIATVYFFIKLL